MSLRIATHERVEALLERMARTVAAAWPGGMTVIGIRRRGVPLAERLCRHLSGIGAAPLEQGELDLKRYSDDLEILHPDTRLRASDIPLELADRRILLVDDVLYTGRTLATAVQYCLDRGATEVRCAVLCEREGREVPIVADFVGLRCDVGEGSVVEVRVPPYEDVLAVEVREVR